MRSLNSEATGLKPNRLGIPKLDALWASHGANHPLAITSSDTARSALLYHLISSTVSAPHNGTIAIIDVSGRFDVTRLMCSFEDLAHVHVFRCTREEFRRTLDGVEKYMIYGEHGSRGREWVGVLVNGDVGERGGDITIGWRGWLRVESLRNEVPTFGVGVSAEEAMGERERRWSVVKRLGWKAVCPEGQYSWNEE